MNLNDRINRLKSKKAALFFDLDGTLLGPDGRVKEEDGEIINRLIQEGHFVFINTGRSKAYLPAGILDMIPFTGMICGASYIECNGKILKNDLLSKKARRQMIDLCRENDIPLVFEGVKTNYYYKCGSSAVKITEDAELSKKEGYIHVDDYCGGDDIQTTKATFMKKITDLDVSSVTELRVIKFKTYGEALIVGNDKANAMDVVLDHLGIAKEDTVSFGDSENDVEMLKSSGISVAMPHAAEAAKTNAHMVCTIREAIERIFY